MKRTTLYLVIALTMVIVLLVLLAAITLGNGDVLNMGFGVLFGLVSIVFTQFLIAWMALTKDQKERLQEARGLSRALSAEIKVFSEVFLANACSLHLYVNNGTNSAQGTQPNELLQFLEPPSRVIFEANASKLPLLEVIEEFGGPPKQQEGLVESVVAFYEEFTYLRSSVIGEAKLQNRTVMLQEVSDLMNELKSNGKFAEELGKRLDHCIRRSAS